jgi:molecular chaperone GrpE
MRRGKKESQKRESLEKERQERESQERISRPESSPLKSSPEIRTPESSIGPQAEAAAEPAEREADPRGSEAVEGLPSDPQAAPPLTDEEVSYLEQLQRLQAEFSNYRRRIQKERAQWDARAKGEVLAGLLPILDDLGRARASIQGEPDGKDAEGLLMVLSRLDDFLASMGVEMQKTEPGTPFDPNHHEAFMTGTSDEYAEGLILETFQPGYIYEEFLLRPARVKVSSGPEKPVSESEEPAAGESAEGDSAYNESVEPQPSEATDTGESG